jgi:catechol 2,3-dioxygenase-like lactoylglutathione lyase family enzyme
MGMPRVDHVGVVVDDLDAVVAFFLFLGFEREGGWTAEGEWVGKIIGLDGVRAEVVMLRAPDGSGKLELSKFHSPADNEGPQPMPSNRLGFRHVSIEVDDVKSIVDGLRDQGFDLVGELCDYDDIYRLCYVRGPEGLIVELAQRIGAEA